VRRVVLTSSVAAVRSSGASTPPVNPPLFSERDWNEVSVRMTGYVLGPGLTQRVHCVSSSACCQAMRAKLAYMRERELTSALSCCNVGKATRWTILRGKFSLVRRTALSRREHTR